MLDYSEYISDLPDIPHDNFAQLLQQISCDHGEKDAILYRCGKEKEFRRWTYSKYAQECRKIAGGLLSAGLVKGDRVVLWAENRPEWMAVWLGTVIAGICIVPVDFLLPDEECLNIIKTAGAKAFFYSGKKKDFASSLVSNGVSLLVSVCISHTNENGGNTEYGDFGAGANTDSRILPPPDSIAANDPASIVFSSGTTGYAKGITLSHKGIIANTSAAIRILEPKENDVFIVVLPLHHTYPTTCAFMAPIAFGLPTVICEKVVGKVVVNDIKDAGVTFFVAVPLLFDKMMTAIMSNYNKLPKIIRCPLNVMRAKALKEAKKGNFEFGQKMFRFIRKKAGLQSIRIMVAGGGPLSVKTADFFDSLGFNIVHGYGMSENSPLISVNTPRHKRNESVGLPVSYTDVKIIDAGPDGIGEIAVKSPSLMLGYFENEKATRQAFTEDGYLLTGDQGCRDDDGYIYIMGRKKNLIVTSGGKNIFPEEIENCFHNSAVISEILVIGKKEAASKGEQVFAVVVPNFDAIKAIDPGKENDDTYVKEFVKKEIEAVNRKLPAYKKICDFTIRNESFEKNAQEKIRRFLYKPCETPKAINT